MTDEVQYRVGEDVPEQVERAEFSELHRCDEPSPDDMRHAPPLLCTRHPGHDGPHVAHGTAMETDTAEPQAVAWWSE